MLWRQIQKDNFTNLEKLLDFLEIPIEARIHFSPHRDFVLNLPRRLAHKIQKKNLNDPLLLQFVPLAIEQVSDGGLLDPVEDFRFKVADSLLQKYKGRALLVTTSACAMHCRYCFRKNFDYAVSDYTEELLHIQKDSTLEEIILSGGDPLSLSDDKLFDLLDKLESIPHLQRIRFHTRFIIGIPERLHEGFIKKLKTFKKQIIFILHINHANELDETIFEACKKLQALCIPVLCQTVLLKRVNDSLEALVDLFKTLVNQGILPYYLHQFDPVEGSMHFEVDPTIGLELARNLKDHLPGYAVPSYVQEIPGRQSKTPLHSLKCFESQNLKPTMQHF